MTIFAPLRIAVLAVLVGAAAQAPAAELHGKLEATRVVDLTQPMYEGMAYWPGGVPFKMEKLVDYDGGYLLHKFEVGENTGTHVDAPAHFIRGNRGIDRIPLADLVAPAVVIDVKDKAAADADYVLTAADVTAWEARYGRIPAHAVVILNTGWHARFAEPERYINADASKTMHFPGFGRDAAELLVTRGVAGIGIDTLSLDPGNSADFAAHKVMLGAGRYQIENLANLDALPPTGATLVVGVLPVRGGSQAQARVLAFLP